MRGSLRIDHPGRGLVLAILVAAVAVGWPGCASAQGASAGSDGPAPRHRPLAPAPSPEATRYPHPDPRAVGEDRTWLECTGAARPPEGSLPPSQRPLPLASASFDSARVVRMAGEIPEVGCALLLLRWEGDRVLHRYGLLESDLPAETLARIESRLLEAQLPHAHRYLFLRVRVVTGPAPELAVGFAWEVPPRLADPAAVEALLAGVHREGASRRDLRLDVLVREDGPAADWIVTRGSGHPRVDQQVLWLLPRIEFRAARVEGLPVERALPLTLTMQGDVP